MPGLERDLVFLSYTREDLEQAKQVYEGFKKRGLKVWLDEMDLTTGRWKPQITCKGDRQGERLFA